MNVVMTAGIVVTVAAGIASYAFLAMQRLALARKALPFMLAGLVAVAVGLLMALDGSSNAAQWVLSVGFTAAVVVAVPAAYGVTRNVGRSADTRSDDHM